MQNIVQILFYVIIGILVLDFVFERYLSVLNIRYSKNTLPAVLQDIYPPEKYARQQEYFRTNTRFGMLTSTVSFVVTILMYSLGGFGWLDHILSNYIDNEIWLSIVFFGLIFFVSDFLLIPFQWYDTFVIEQKFGFNKATPKIFVLDKLKSYLITVVLGGGLLYLIIWIYTLTPQYFWLIAFGVIMAFSLFMSMFYSEIIVPLFNKQTPLHEGELRDEIEKFANKAGFKLNNIYVIDGSKRSTKANAYFTGFGAKKRIVLYDTLIEKMSAEEIVAVLSHEIGHYKHKHTLINFLLNIPYMLLLFFFFGYVLQSDVFAQALGGTAASFHLNALAFSILYSPVSFVLDIGMNVLSRKFEYQADGYTAKLGYGKQLIMALKKLSADSLSNLTPHPLYVFFYYSHPTLYQRILNIDKTKLEPESKE
ncbi:M48 family peptidase [Paludibacter sp. 221]|uniref:M48 family metallopeptidase n=1 Tax=Paludibacter sp. 221 TaxID=2302939 RepID=UPI0013D771AA|nr:M48 family metallopeptidase [Paludibacter sp. 221]NDV46363.1 M48 family peptidase [Paludibacter sp. 221]